MHGKNTERYFFFGLLVATVIFTFFIFQPFWIVIVLGACFAVVLRPVYEMFRKVKFPSWLSSLLTVILFTILICGPLFGLSVIIFNQSQSLYSSLVHGGGASFLDSLNRSIQEVLPHGVNLDLNQKANDLVGVLSNNLGEIFSTTLSTIFSFILTLLAVFYFLKDGAEWKRSIVNLSPLSDSDNLKIIDKLSHAIKGVILGYLFVAAVQGTLMGIGLTIFGVPSPALWGVVAAIGSLTPTLGTAIVSIPAVIYLLATGHPAMAIGLAIWSTIIVGTIDNLLNPYIVGNRINIPPFLILFSVLGGAALLGPVGILIGPLSVSLLYILVSIYRDEFQKQNAD